MTVNDEARTALDEKQIAVRAAATRELALNGGFDDVERLVAMATEDKSPSVRLYAAAAAGSILMRGRGAYDQTQWTEKQRRSVLDWVGRSDPARIPSLLLSYAAFADTDVIKRLTRMLRDPRYGVRAGAAAAIRRMALSGACTREGPGLREWVGDALGHRKLPADAAIELVRLIGETGWSVLLPAARKIGASVEDVLTEASARCEERNHPKAWAGVWVDEGRDVLDERPAVTSDWLVIGEDVQPTDGELVHEGQTYRRLWAPRAGADGSHAAIQANGRTWWRREDKALIAFILETDKGLASADAAELNRYVRGSTATAMRARALVFARAGEGQPALDELSTALKAKKPRNDLYFIEGLAWRALGDGSKARESFGRYLEKAKKKDPWRAEAESLLQNL